jgi:hypothetical protein
LATTQVVACAAGGWESELDDGYIGDFGDFEEYDAFGERKPLSSGQVCVLIDHHLHQLVDGVVPRPDGNLSIIV